MIKNKIIPVVHYLVDMFFLGAWNTDGKGENIWDHHVHNSPELMAKGVNGDIASNSYHKYKEDVALLKDLGVNHYLFSLSWSRILPNGNYLTREILIPGLKNKIILGINDEVNSAGVAYYKNLIKELRDNGIEPFVTIYHWDLLEILEKQGGWIDSFIIDIYADYSRLCFELFGDDVKYWLTFNDPRLVCLNGYGYGTVPPMIVESGLLDYKCSHILLRAHAKVWHIYDEEFRSKQNGNECLL